MGATSWNGTGVSASAGAQTAVYYPQHGYITEVKLPAGAAIYQQSPHSLATYHTLPPLSKYGLTIADSAPITAVNLADVGWDILAVLFAASSQNGPGLWVFEYSFVSGSWAAPYNLPVSSSSTYGTVEWISGTTWAKTSTGAYHAANMISVTYQVKETSTVQMIQRSYNSYTPTPSWSAPYTILTGKTTPLRAVHLAPYIPPYGSTPLPKLTIFNNDGSTCTQTGSAAIIGPFTCAASTATGSTLTGGAYGFSGTLIGWSEVHLYNVHSGKVYETLRTGAGTWSASVDTGARPGPYTTGYTPLAATAATDKPHNYATELFVWYLGATASATTPDGDLSVIFKTLGASSWQGADVETASVKGDVCNSGPNNISSNLCAQQYGSATPVACTPVSGQSESVCS